jgi:hypothetical protein
MSAGGPLQLIGLVMILAGFLFLTAGFAISFAPLSIVTFKAGELEAQIAGISMPVATALWTGVVLIILGFAAIVLSRR